MGVAAVAAVAAAHAHANAHAHVCGVEAAGGSGGGWWLRGVLFVAVGGRVEDGRRFDGGDG